MPLWVLVILQWAHVILAIFWFGSVLYIDFILIPTVQGLPRDAQGAISGPIGDRSQRVITPIAGIVVLLGIIRGLANGVVGNLGSAYGVSYLLSLVLGVVLIVWGVRVISPAARKLATLVPGPELDAGVARIRTLTLLELSMFLIVFSLMIAMRFGY